MDGHFLLGTGAQTNILPWTVFLHAAPYDWGPGNQILLDAYEPADSHIYVVNADGTGLTALTSGSQYGTVPRWRVVSPAPILFQTQPTNQVGIWDKTATFTVEASGVGTLTYQWLKDGQPIDGATGAT